MQIARVLFLTLFAYVSASNDTTTTTETPTTTTTGAAGNGTVTETTTTTETPTTTTTGASNNNNSTAVTTTTTGASTATTTTTGAAGNITLAPKFTMGSYAGNATAADIESQLMGDAHFKGNVTKAVLAEFGNAAGLTAVVRKIDVTGISRRLEEGAQVRELSSTITIAVSVDVTGTSTALEAAKPTGATGYDSLQGALSDAATAMTASVQSLPTVGASGVAAAAASATDSTWVSANVIEDLTIASTQSPASSSTTSGAVTMGVSSALFAAVAFFTM